MHPNARLVQDFYAAFDARDAERTAACYAPDATFSDPVFPLLRGDEVGDMWRMLCHRGRDLRVRVSGVEADDARGRAHWEAEYSFGATGRRVHNRIDATFTFRDGRIATHVDRFDLWRWTRMALGARGLLLGWTPFVQGAVRRQAAATLRAWRAREGGTQDAR